MCEFYLLDYMERKKKPKTPELLCLLKSFENFPSWDGKVPSTNNNVFLEWEGTKYQQQGRQ